MNCPICNNLASEVFTSEILNKYRLSYFQCSQCEYLFTERPAFWLKEAYQQSINITDTGIVSRNENMAKKLAMLLMFFNGKNGTFVDYAGGYGLLTRMMRDRGFDFLWTDPYTTNLFAQGFEYKNNQSKIDLVVALECFEHFENPIIEIEKILNLSENIFISTLLMPQNIDIKNWWYLGKEHGQHIGFFTHKTLMHLANKYRLHLCSNGVDIHLLSKRKTNNFLFKIILVLAKVISIRFKSKIFSDHQLLKQSFPVESALTNR